MRTIHWNNSLIEWEWIAASALCMLALLFYVEVRRKRKRRLGARLVLLFCMVLSLALMALNPAWKQEQRKFSAVLLTEDYKPEILDSLQDKSKDSLKIFVHDKCENQSQGKPVSGIEQISSQYPEVEQLFIVGNPLPDFREEFNYPLKLVPLLNQLPDGISEIDFPDEVGINEPIQVRGKIRNVNDSTASLVLVAPHGKEDSLFFSKGVSTFSLTAYPKVAGKFLYTLLEKRPGENEEKKYRLPIVVKPFEPLRIAIRTNAPTFEIRSLKNWLGETGHQVAVLSRISKAVYHREFINQKNSFNAEISEDNLAKLDVLMLEGAVLSALSSSQLAALENAVVENGLSMIIFGDQEVIRRRNTDRLKLFLDFGIEAIDSKDQVLKKIIHGKNIQGEIKKLPFKFLDVPHVVRHFEGMYASRKLGLGKVGLLLSTTTHTLNLSGKNNLYSHYWSAVFNDILPDHAFQPGWKLSESTNFVNTEVNLNLLNYSDVPQAVVLNDDSTAVALSMLQNRNFSGHWQAKFWPSKTGWYKAHVPALAGLVEDQGLEKWFYAVSDTSWKTLLMSQASEKMEAYNRNSNYNAEMGDKSPVYTYRAIDKIYFFAIFLLSCGLLWIEQKF